ncbi:unnamed protein product [Cyprideis torosa]|uniref:Uncharacterized protein n=1 Tax=Cyprideis torosa TaxID=163714 RepID=A0A7R8W1J5_9CRUS|nr:unnamed protein product [Cyprideis torosa]CAG0880985.1 unnamed protein product [Cyprideis torosa]
MKEEHQPERRNFKRNIFRGFCLKGNSSPTSAMSFFRFDLFGLEDKKVSHTRTSTSLRLHRDDVAKKEQEKSSSSSLIPYIEAAKKLKKKGKKKGKVKKKATRKSSSTESSSSSRDSQLTGSTTTTESIMPGYKNIEKQQENTEIKMKLPKNNTVELEQIAAKSVLQDVDEPKKKQHLSKNKTKRRLRKQEDVDWHAVLMSGHFASSSDEQPIMAKESWQKSAVVSMDMVSLKANAAHRRKKVKWKIKTQEKSGSGTDVSVEHETKPQSKNKTTTLPPNKKNQEESKLADDSEIKQTVIERLEKKESEERNFLDGRGSNRLLVNFPQKSERKNRVLKLMEKARKFTRKNQSKEKERLKYDHRDAFPVISTKLQEAGKVQSTSSRRTLKESSVLRIPSETKAGECETGRHSYRKSFKLLVRNLVTKLSPEVTSPFLTADEKLPMWDNYCLVPRPPRTTVSTASEEDLGTGREKWRKEKERSKVVTKSNDDSTGRTPPGDERKSPEIVSQLVPSVIINIDH